MAKTGRSRNISRIAIAALVVLAAGCAPTPVPPAPAPPPPPPPKAEPIPNRPLPPSGASYLMDIPQLGADGSRMTINSGLGRDETTWHFRSAMNVAALNCRDARYQPVLDAYTAFLKDNSRTLTAANKAIDSSYRAREGSSSKAIRAREVHMTQLYNYFALPPALGNFCNAALAVANEALQAPPKDAHLFAAANLPRLESAFDQFFRQYETYRIESAAWDARYGQQYGASQPGYVAVHGNNSGSIVTGFADNGENSRTLLVADPLTGAAIPVRQESMDSYSTPVVQPIANDNAGEDGK